MTNREMLHHFEAVVSSVSGENGKPLTPFVVPSFYKMEEEGVSFDKWEVTWKQGPLVFGKYRVVAESPIWAWGGHEPPRYTGEVLTDPNWEDLMIEANRMVLATKDFHHRFLEGFFVRSSDIEKLAASADVDVVLKIELVMGS